MGLGSDSGSEVMSARFDTEAAAFLSLIGVHGCQYFLVMQGNKYTSNALLRMFRIKGVGLGNILTSRVSIFKLKPLIINKEKG